MCATSMRAAPAPIQARLIISPDVSAACAVPRSPRRRADVRGPLLDLVAEAAADDRAELEDRVVGDAVADEVPNATTGDEARLQEEQHLLRDVLPRRPGDVRQL